MKKEVRDFKRKELFDLYNSRMNPFAIVTTKIDITNIYNLCLKKKHIYGTIGYYLTLALNDIEEFKYTYEDGKIYKCDKMIPNFADIRNDTSLGFYECDLKDNYDDFIKEYELTKEQFLNGTYAEKTWNDGVVWLSCQPWYHFSSLVPPFDKNTTVPQLIWDKFSFEEDKCYINLMIFVHHGFADGYHIGKLITKIEEVINNIQN